MDDRHDDFAASVAFVQRVGRGRVLDLDSASNLLMDVALGGLDADVALHRLLNTSQPQGLS